MSISKEVLVAESSFSTSFIIPNFCPNFHNLSFTFLESSLLSSEDEKKMIRYPELEAIAAGRGRAADDVAASFCMVVLIRLR
jgi:hypothetical protein